MKNPKNLRMQVCAAIGAAVLFSAVFALAGCDDGSTDPSGSNNPSGAGTKTVTSADDWKAFLKELEANGGTYEVTIAGDAPIVVMPFLEYASVAKSFDVTLKGTGTLQLDITGVTDGYKYIFYLNGNIDEFGETNKAIQNLTIDGPTLKGADSNNPLVFVGGKNTLTGSTDISAKLVLKSGNITGNKGGGVYVYGKGAQFDMEGGEISGNSASEKGGGVYISSGATFNMTSGTISGNEVRYLNPNGNVDDKSAFGGGVYIDGTQDWSPDFVSFTKTGGKIYGTNGSNADLKNKYTEASGGIGHGAAVYYFKSQTAGDQYYCDTDLLEETTGNITTANLPTGETPVGNWTKIAE